MMYDKWQKKSFKKDISKRENMTYVPEKDHYLCAAGKKLIAKYFSQNISQWLSFRSDVL